jgi:hypothetical protein
MQARLPWAVPRNAEERAGRRDELPDVRAGYGSDFVHGVRTSLRDPEQRALHLHAIAVDCGERLPPSSAEARPGSVARTSATPAERAIENQLFTGRS